MGGQLDQQKIKQIVSKQPGPAECAKRSAAPACRARRARPLPLSRFSCLSPPVPVLPGLARSWKVLDDLFPLLNPPQPAPTFRQAAPDQRSWSALFSHLFFDLIFYRFFLRFGLHFGSQNRPKTGKNRKKMLLNSESGFAAVFLQFFVEFWSFFERPNP